METRARYTIVGLFTLLVTAAAFTFVYWLNTAGGLGARAYYRVDFEGSVSGLLRGSAVLFNGVRVGEVTELVLNEADPRKVTATIAIDVSTPVRADTKAGIEFQGLMGSPAVSLRGGSSETPLATAPGEIPALAADPGSGKSMTEAAREVLGRIDSVVADNAESLKSAIANIDKFSSALGRNSDRVDGIMAGLEKLTGGGAAKAQATVYDLTAAREFPTFEKPAAMQLVVRDPTASFVMSQDAILVRSDAGLAPVAGGGKWSDLLPNVFLARVVQSFENAGLLKEVMRPGDGVTGEFQLVTDLRAFDIAAAPETTAEIEFSAKVLRSDGQVVDARVFSASAPAKAVDAQSAAAALDQIFGKLAAELVVWTVNVVRNPS
jgi:phospholipid/cholesterol/gamma-HCH transport system substrate-binding protein